MRGPNLEDARRFEAAARGTATEVHIYADAQHGFMDPQNPWGGYDEKAARESWTARPPSCKRSSRADA